MLSHFREQSIGLYKLNVYLVLEIIFCGFRMRQLISKPGFDTYSGHLVQWFSGIVTNL